MGEPRLPHGIPRAPPLPACMNRSYVSLAMERLSKFCFSFDPQAALTLARTLTLILTLTLTLT